MNRSYYEISCTVNTCMKFILVVYMCLAGVCEGVYEQTPYDSRELCMQSADETRTYMMQNFPMSSGELYCITEEEFIKYQNYFDQTKGV